MAESHHPFRRSRKFINSWAQVSIAVEVVIHALLLVALISLLLFAEPFATMFSQYSAEDHQAVAKELFHLNIGKWPLFLGLAVFIGIVSVLFSHHIVGPAYHLKRVVSELLDRNLRPRLKFRKWDYLIEVESEFNQVIDLWGEDIDSIDKSVEEALQLQKNSGSAADIERALKNISLVTQKYRASKEA